MSEEIPLLKIARGLNFEKHAVSRIIKLMSKKLVMNRYSKKNVIHELNSIVVIDESKFCTRKYNKGHKVKGVWVLDCVERTHQRKNILKQSQKRGGKI